MRVKITKWPTFIGRMEQIPIDLTAAAITIEQAQTRVKSLVNAAALYYHQRHREINREERKINRTIQRVEQYAV